MRLASCALFFALTTLLIGCGGDNKADVKGTVKFDGKLIEDGTIRFESVDGKSPTTGESIKDGQYAAKVPLGNMKVSFSASKVVGKKKLYDTPDSPYMELKENALPDKYRDEKTEIRFEVKPGINQKDWELTSK